MNPTILCLALLSAAPPPTAAGLDPALEAIAARMQKVSTLQADVSQEKELAVFDETVRSRGQLAFARPQRLWLDFEGKDGTTLVVDGDLMALRYKALGRTERYRLSHDVRARAIAEHIFMLLDADPKALASVYDVAVTGHAPLVVRLSPKAKELASVIRAIDATFGEDGLIRRIEIHEAGGDLTRWTFSRVRLNEPLPVDRFALPAD